MALKSTFTPKASLTEAPTNLKEAIDWVLRVTGRDGKKLGDGECICGLASAVTDLLQSVELEYNGYEGDRKDGDSGATNNGPPKEKVKERLNGLFSLVQGLGGTAVVRTYIDQLAQVLSALVGWSTIETCGGDKCKGTGGNENPHGQNGCEYLGDVERTDRSCETCGCMKYEAPTKGNEGVSVGRGCTKCKDEKKKQECKCSPGGCHGGPGKECECAKEGKCCKCCCKSCVECQKKECSCTEKENSYKSAYQNKHESWIEGKVAATWTELKNDPPGIYHPRSITAKRHQCARILLGSVCLIWSGLTYMYWTGKYEKTSPRWNNHILDGSGLDDGTLSQWLQALGFPRDMLNNHGPQNRLDKVIWDGISDKLLLGFAVPKGLSDSGVANDTNGNTARNPFAMNYAGFVHTAHRDSFNNEAIVFKDDPNHPNKLGAIFKLYILSCAYFTGLQKKSSTQSTAPKNPNTIREILYWLSALPYSQAYKEMLKYSKEKLKEVLKKPGESDISDKTPTLAFHQTGRNHPITVDEYNLFAHFQAVTQYCPLVLIGIQGGIHSTNKTTPAIHSLYSNSHFSFTYPAVDIQAYNQVVHYIRALFYQLYFLRKQCAVKVALGGKWRECRYGSGVLGKDVVSWMCLGCSPMEHDRKSRVDELKKGLVGVKGTGDAEKLKEKEEEEETVSSGDSITLAEKLKTLLEAIGQVVVQLGNAQEALERRKGEEINKVKGALLKAKGELEGAKGELYEKVKGDLEFEVENADTATNALKRLIDKDGNQGLLVELTGKNGGGNGILGDVDGKLGSDSSGAKDKISEAINKVRDALNVLKKWAEKIHDDEQLKEHQEALLDAIKKLISICNSPKCPTCKEHRDKCGRRGKKKTCEKCHQQYMDGFPSALQAFLEDRLPGFSCHAVPTDDNPLYPPAASHLGHCGGSGQCCPLPMGFRNQFHKGSTSDMIGSRLYGILYFFSNENMMQSCVYTLVRVTAALSATTPQVLGDVFGFFRGGVGNPVNGEVEGQQKGPCQHDGDPRTSTDNKKYYCGWCASGLREEVKGIQWIPKTGKEPYRETLGTALIKIKDDKEAAAASSSALKSGSAATPSALSALTKDSEYLSPLTGELYTAVSATFGGTYLSWVLYLSDALQGGLQSLASAFKQIECRGCKGQCDPNKCKKGSHGSTADGSKSTPLCQCPSIVSCTGVLPVLYRHGFGYGNPFNLEGYQLSGKDSGDYSITENKDGTKQCHQFLDSLQDVIWKKEEVTQSQDHPLTKLLSEVGKLQYDIRLPWIFVLTVAWLVAVLYLSFGAIWPLDWTHMRSHWLRGGEHQWQCMWYKVMTGRKGVELVEYFGRR